MICEGCGYEELIECVCPVECWVCGGDQRYCDCHDGYEDDDWGPAPRSTVTVDTRGLT